MKWLNPMKWLFKISEPMVCEEIKKLGAFIEANPESVAQCEHEYQRFEKDGVHVECRVGHFIHELWVYSSGAKAGDGNWSYCEVSYIHRCINRAWDVKRLPARTATRLTLSKLP